MDKLKEARELANQFNEPARKEKRMQDIVSHIVDILLEEIINVAKRGLYDMAYKFDDMEKERMRLANVQEEDVVKFIVAKMKELGFQAGFTRPYIHVSWQ